VSIRCPQQRVRLGGAPPAVRLDGPRRRGADRRCLRGPLRPSAAPPPPPVLTSAMPTSASALGLAPLLRPTSQGKPAGWCLRQQPGGQPDLRCLGNCRRCVPGLGTAGGPLVRHPSQGGSEVRSPSSESLRASAAYNRAQCAETPWNADTVGGACRWSPSVRMRGN
jgi:hypothetical protein